ncbi:hydantoinase/oxoprolinase family protein [Pimelobacter simplex]|uniref:hydantoinase/oxoprolinase family protein n=1 Tax=Nocardioides simplex TaxID=2045 RepID=UPI0021500A98|nr:hydantoinase/oxoprolinase family protein [Pimelobacter simplex]UUW91242.1 hydantoinase/oxoprolinase family protein [Pimelobacter simplex]UUW95070.1 hydantoinase/oxoprolinase family protein [Pimelobacter simplex]
MAGSFRVSVDTGGTFTDVIGVDASSGELFAVKTPSNREDPSRALLEGVAKVLEAAGKTPEEIELVIHGTTTATNAVLEHEFDGIGLLVTTGFRHLVEIARQSVPDGYGNSYFWVKPPRIVPLHLVREVPERLAYDGAVLEPLDLDAVRTAAAELVESGVNRLGVCLLHAYANDKHEREIGQMLAEEFPDLFVSLSSVVLPEYREYERAMTTLIDVMVKPYCKTYLGAAQRDLNEVTGGRPFLIMQSNGGVVSAETAGDKPVTMLLSGPAGGVLGAIEAARSAGVRDLITLDVGGTSTDVALIEDLKIRLTSETVIENYPVKVPMIDIATVGTGGGSIAWQGPGESLKVGPKSAGAYPGPISYGRGGTAPTVTDAAAILGRLPDALVGGELNLAKDAARTAFDAFGTQFGLSAEEAAAGVLEVAVIGQVAGIRQVSTLKGRDPSAYALVAFGGAGPLLANEVAEALGMRRVLVPPTPGNLSAFGLQVSDVKRDYVRTLVRDLDAGNDATVVDEIEKVWLELEAAGRGELRAEGVPTEQVSLVRGADLRYVGEGYEVSVVIDDLAGDAAVRAVEAAFHEEHNRVYGFSYAGEQQVEVVALRVQALGELHRPTLATAPKTGSGGAPEPTGSRSVYWRSTGWIECPTYDRASLGDGDAVAGPAIVEEYGSTYVVPTGWDATVDHFGNILSERKDA